MINNSNILIYQTNNGNIHVNVKFEDETLWLSRAQICEVFSKVKSTISEYIKSIFENAKLDVIVTVNLMNILSNSKELYSYNSLNTPLPPLTEVPTKGFSL